MGMRLISLLVVWFGLSLFYDRSGYWSSNRTPSSMAIGQMPIRFMGILMR